MQLQFTGRHFYNSLKQKNDGQIITSQVTAFLDDKDGIPHLTTFRTLTQEINAREVTLFRTQIEKERALGLKYIVQPTYSFEKKATALREKMMADFSNSSLLNTNAELEAYAKSISTEVQSMKTTFDVLI